MGHFKVFRNFRSIRFSNTSLIFYVNNAISHFWCFIFKIRLKYLSFISSLFEMQVHWEMAWQWWGKNIFCIKDNIYLGRKTKSAHSKSILVISDRAKHCIHFTDAWDCVNGGKLLLSTLLVLWQSENI